MTNTFTCEINKSSHCSTQTRPDCKQATWNECREVPVKECKPKKIHVPTQELLHRKKCLLPDDIALSSGAGQCQYQYQLPWPRVDARHNVCQEDV